MRDDEDFDRERVEEFLREKSSIAKIAANPAAHAQAERAFRENGWVPEDGKDALTSLIEFAAVADADVLNGLGMPFEEKWTDDKIAQALSEKTKLGTPTELKQAMRIFRHRHIADGVLARMARKDFAIRPEAVPPNDERNERMMRDGQERWNLVANQARDATPNQRQTPATPAEAIGQAATTHDSVRAAMEHLEHNPRTSDQ